MALAVVCLVLALSNDPGSGTSVNLHTVDDVRGLVVGHHHAKPMPASIDVSALFAALRLAVLAVLVAASVARVAGVVLDVEGDGSVVVARRAPRRGPPMLA